MYDKVLFNKMAEIDKALLLAHEYLYLIGKEGGHRDSNAVRKITAFLFAHQAFNFHGEYNQLPQAFLAMRLIIDYPFGDYMRFFIEEQSLKTAVAPGTGFSRHQALISIMKSMRDEMSSCLAARRQQGDSAARVSQIHNECQEKIIFDNRPLWAGLTPEEAFVFLGRFHFDLQTESWSSNSEFLETWDEQNPSAVSLSQMNQAKMYCSEILRRPAVRLLEVQEKAAQYCRDIIGVPVPSFTEIPIQTYFSCFSPKQILIWHDVAQRRQDRPSFAIEVDSQTGAIQTPEFAGSAQLLTQEERGVLKNLGYGNRSYQAMRVYRLTPANDEDRRQIAEFVTREPETFVRMEFATNVQNAGSLVSNSWPEAKERLSNESDRALLRNFDLKLEDCTVTETNLAPNAWFVY